MRRVVAAIVMATLLAGCGYTSRSLISESHSTIAVPVFENPTRRRDLEWELTRAVVEELQGRSHLRVVDLAHDPDLVLHGSLSDVDEELLSKRRYQRIRESSVHLAAKIRVTNRQGDEVVSERTVHERESFTPVVGENVRTAREEAMRALAERIVRELESGW